MEILSVGRFSLNIDNFSYSEMMDPSRDGQRRLKVYMKGAPSFCLRGRAVLDFEAALAQLRYEPITTDEALDKIKEIADEVEQLETR